MPYISDLQFFHDLDKNPENEPESFHGEIDKEKKEDEGEKKWNQEKKPENFSNDMVDRYEEAINLVKNFSLKNQFKEDLNEAAIIDSRKETILILLRRILDDIERYTNQIGSLRLARLTNYDTSQEYQDAIGRSDVARRSIHNKLISDLKLAMKLINVSFNKDFPAEQRIIEEKKYADRKSLSDKQIGEALSKREFVKFPNGPGVFINWENCPKEPEQERKFIMDWAIAFYNDLSKLREEIDGDIQKEPSRIP
ncbi:MAG: hypothetical protein WC523_03095 [Patescibacteria group bacterium]|jgi:hypothetical protein